MQPYDNRKPDTVNPRVLWGLIGALGIAAVLLLIPTESEREAKALSAEVAALKVKLEILSKAHESLAKDSEWLTERVNALDFAALAEWRKNGTITANHIFLQTKAGELPMAILAPNEFNIFGNPLEDGLQLTHDAVRLKIGENTAFMGPAQGSSKEKPAMIVQVTAKSGQIRNEAELVATGVSSLARVGSLPPGASVYSKSARLESSGENALVEAMDLLESKSASMNSSQILLSKSNRALLKLDVGERGARLAIFDEVGKTSRLNMALNPESGEPFIRLDWANKFNVFAPQYDKPLK